MSLKLLQIDAFAAEPFSGNPAAVCFLDEPRDDAWLLNLAQEMSLSETAFLLRRNDGWGLRWFTPALEVELCGHATLASAHALWETGRLPATEQARFHTRSGLLTCARRDDAIEMSFPATPARQTAPPEGLAAALGAEPVWCGVTPFDLLCELDSEATLRALAPDYRAMKDLLEVRGIIATAASSGALYDFVSRYFAPGSGIDEDPVTGSAHCALAPYWAPKLGKSEMLAYQASPRGGEVGVRIEGERIALRGRAVTVLEGELSV